MIDCIFSSLSGGNALKRAILYKLEELMILTPNSKASVSIFAFSLTDEEIASKIVSVAKNNTEISFRIIADWSQRGIKGNRQIYGLSNSNLTNISVRYKLDQPYLKSENKALVKWSYRESHGLLHHKTLSVSINGKFENLILGSFNWTKSATYNYENLLILYPQSDSIIDVCQKFQNEFDYMWNNSDITASPFEATNHFNYIKSKLTQSIPQIPVFSESREDSEKKKVLSLNGYKSILVAFNSKGMKQKVSQRGYSPQNNNEKFYLTKPFGKVKSVPLSITNLVLEIIYKAKEGDDLKVAAYALSAKAAEFGALIEAARRKVNVYLLLDYKINNNLVEVIESKYTSLPIHIRTTSKRLHSKYIVHPNSNSVLTGTANFTMDASKRHTEHRLLIQKNAEVTSAFLQDFQTIWDRTKKREEDKPRLYLSNNGSAALDIPHFKYKINFINCKILSKLFLFYCHKYLLIKFLLMDSVDKSENLPGNELLQIINKTANDHFFRVFVIGSYIDYITGLKDNHSSDIDLCICPSQNHHPKNAEIESIILWLKEFGARHKVSFDVKFSQIAPSREDTELHPNQKISFIKLYSPYLQAKVSKGLLTNYSFIGKYLISFELDAKDTNFFNKLPQIENSKKKYLRGALELKFFIDSVSY